MAMNTARLKELFMKETLPIMALKVFDASLCFFRSAFFLFFLKKAGANLKIRENVKISGSRNIYLGKNCYIGRNVVLDASSGELRVGDGVEIRDGVRLYAKKITIGDGVTIGEGAFLNGAITVASGGWISRGCDLTGNVIIERAILGPHVTCMGGDGHIRDPKTGAVLMSDRGLRDSQSPEDQKAIRILDGAWVGHGAILLKNVTVFPKAVVGAGSVVTKDVFEGMVVAGNPARSIKSKLCL